jgi:hypothetical protein
MTNAVIPGLDPATGMFSLPWWAASVVAAFLVVCFVFAILRVGVVGMAAAIGGTAILAFALWGGWTWADHAAQRDRANERQALAARALELTARAVSPGSPLACLDGGAGETVEASCEKTLFATPEAVAAATAYVAARIALLSDAADYAQRAKVDYEGPLPAQHRALEGDRFGFVAQVLATGYNCSAEKCDALALFRDPSRLKDNLKDRVFEGFVARNAAAWPARASRPVASSGPNPNGGPSPVPPGFNVPSAASIPPVNIMASEPPASAAPPAVATTENPANPPAKRPPARTTRPTAGTAPAPPVQIVPPGATAGAAPPKAQ